MFWIDITTCEHCGGTVRVIASIDDPDVPHKAVAALGIHGQLIYVDPKARVVIVRQASDPEAESDISETDGPRIYHEIATRLMRSVKNVPDG